MRYPAANCWNNSTKMVKNKSFSYVCFCDSNLYMLATLRTDVCQILKNATLVLPDGVSIKLTARLLGQKISHRLPGPTTMLEYCRHGVKSGLRHFFYGATSGVAEQLALNFRREIPGINIVGTYTPPFRPLTAQEELDVKNQIEQSGTDVLWVGLGAPKQEHWMAEHVGKIDVPLMLGVGAAFDFHSGNRRWAPPWIRKAGLEWAYRMFTGGKRVFWRNLRCVTLSSLIMAREIMLSHLGLAQNNK